MKPLICLKTLLICALVHQASAILAATSDLVPATNRVDATTQQRRGRFGAPERGVYKARINPHWLRNDARFWYRNDLKGGAKEFILVEAERGNRQPAFDHQKLAAALSKAAGQEYKADRLPFSEIEFSEDGKSVAFEAADKKWRCDLTSYECAAVTGSTSSVEPRVKTEDLLLANAAPDAVSGSFVESEEYGSPAAEDAVLAQRQTDQSQGQTNGQERARGPRRGFGGRRGDSEREATSRMGSGGRSSRSTTCMRARRRTRRSSS